MRKWFAAAIVMLLVLTGCGGGGTVSVPSSGGSSDAPAVRTYNGTASVGDFLSLSVDANAHTIAYQNLSNGDQGTVSYTVNSDGTYTISDPSGNLLSAYEVPDYAMLIEAAKTGPNHDTPALITAIAKGNISLDTWKNHAFNYMQFRTTSGGLEIGSVSLDASGNVSVSNYWPYGATMEDSQPFGAETMPASNFQNGPNGTYLTMSESGAGTDYVFGTANGVFAVDTENGAILGFAKSASKAFDPSVAGTYHAVYYQKNGASAGMNNVELGTPMLNHATITVSSNGQVTAVDPQGNALLSATLTAVGDASYLYDGTASKLADPCYGMFTFRTTHAGATEDTFVTFVNGAMLFSEFSSPSSTGSGYDYLYGVGLK